jgi:biotin transport system substrate-specific component
MLFRVAGPGTSSTLLGVMAARADMTRPMQVAAVLFVTALTAAAAQMSIPLPFTPVPLTMQPLVVLLGGAVLGARLGMMSQVVYLSLGIAGLPVFAASPILPQGALRLLGPTGGYLMAYPFAAFVAGWCAERQLDRRYVTSVLSMLAGLTLVFAGGVLWLAWFARPAAAGFDLALRTGFYPFVVVDLIKVLVAAAIMPATWRLSKSRIPYP